MGTTEETKLDPMSPVDRAATFRIIDAAANRAREGLRVLEDFARFQLDDAHLTRLLKETRHAMTEAIRTIGPSQLMASRDTGGDVGTDITTPAESVRQTPDDVVSANFKRVQEALRTLEEYGKCLSADVGQRFEQLRYRMYSVEKAVVTGTESQRRLAGRRLYLLVTEALCRHDVDNVVRDAIAGGVDIIQVREKTLCDRVLLNLIKRIRNLTRETDTLLFVNDRPDLASLADADGVHLGQEELPVRAARRILGPGKLVGVSTHNIEQARQAVLDGADYLGVGPVFASKTKQFDRIAGIEFVQEVVGEIALPWFAIGGIDAGNIGSLIDAGATRVAVSSCICGDDSPAKAARRIREKLDAVGSAS